MKKKLKELLKNSHSPYSKVKVSSIVIDKSGKEYHGVNVENAAFPSSICAERSAMFNAISSGVKPGELTKIYIHSSIDGLKPCGACLQVMSELLDDEAKIHIVGTKEEVFSLEDLMPKRIKKESFGWK